MPPWLGLHWIDASTLEFLGQFVAEGLHDRILTALTFRPEFTTPWPAIAHQSSLALNRLTRRQVGELIREETGGALPDSLVAQVYLRTGGVPLLVEEFTRIMRESVDARDIPSTLQDLVLRRLDRMASNREVVQVAATLGREFHYDILAAVVSIDAPALLAELEKLVRQILLLKGQPPPAPTFSSMHSWRGAARRSPERRKSFTTDVRAMERLSQATQRQPDLVGSILPMPVSRECRLFGHRPRSDLARNCPHERSPM